VFLQGGGFFFSTSGSAEWNTTGRMVVKDRSMRWLDLNVGVGVARRIDFVDLNAGLGLSEIKWWIRDTRRERVGTEVITTHSDWRDSFETRNPVMGFLGIDFILPHQYRLSAQAGVRSMNAAEITVSVSQGLEKE
jgi:hypothetical protein